MRHYDAVTGTGDYPAARHPACSIASIKMRLRQRPLETFAHEVQ
jgi:hypothetical protein